MMGYRCGIGPGLARLGLTPAEPGYYCDVCGRRIDVTKRNGMPYGWLLDGKLPPKWKKTDKGDTCPVCLNEMGRAG